MTSKKTGMRVLPWVKDVEAEHGQVLAEAVEAALLTSLQQQAAAGAITPPDLARISELAQTGDMTLAQIVQKVHDEAQKRQASSGAPGTPEGPTEPGAPEAQPGLAQPGQGQEVPSIGPPGVAQNNLRGILADLSKGRSVARAG